MAIITLTTDIGQQDYLVGAIKGQLLSQNANFNIVDITHYLSNTNYNQAAYICSNAFRHYPENTFHVVLLNLFDSQRNHFLVARYNNQYIICPDNGILTMIAGAIPKEIAFVSLEEKHTLLSRTAVFAEVINYIDKQGKFEVDQSHQGVIEEKYPFKAAFGSDWIEGQILFIDHFENVVVNITKEEFEEARRGRTYQIVINRNEIIDTISDNYASIIEGNVLAWFNSAGYLEIAINKGNMAGLFGLQGYNESMNETLTSSYNKIFYQTVKIFFK